MTSAELDRLNPHFGNKYMSPTALWKTIRGPLSSNGLSVLQLVSADGLLVTVETMLVHASGEYVRTTLALTARDVSAQALGSLTSYLRRYALSALVGGRRRSRGRRCGGGRRSPEDQRGAASEGCRSRRPYHGEASQAAVDDCEGREVEHRRAQAVVGGRV
jgi:hypothetical protein